MSTLPNLLRLRSLSLSAGLLFTLASAPVLVGPAHAQAMGNMPNMGGSVGAGTSTSATGTVESVNAQQRKIKLNHEPIPSIGWPAMSMEFPAASSVDLTKVKPGSKVKFTLSKGSNGTYTVESLSAAQ